MYTDSVNKTAIEHLVSQQAIQFTMNFLGEKQARTGFEAYHVQTLLASTTNRGSPNSAPRTFRGDMSETDGFANI